MHEYVESREGRGRVEVEVAGCKCEAKPLIVKVKSGSDVVRSYCARCEQDLQLRYYGGSGSIRIPFGALVERDRPWQPRDPNEQY